MFSLEEAEILEAAVPRETSKMWNDKVEASPKERKEWIVPALFTGLVIVAFLSGFIIGYG